jgi:hypothetical protein
MRFHGSNSSPENRKTLSIHIFSNHVRVLATRYRESDASCEDIPLPPAEQQGRYLFVAMAARSARTKFRVQLGDAALLITLAPLTDHRSTNPAAPGDFSVGPHHRQTAARSARAANECGRLRERTIDRSCDFSNGLQSNGRSIRRLSASTVSSTGWLPSAIASMIRGERKPVSLPTHPLGMDAN